MKKPEITMTVIKEEKGYSATATAGTRHIFTEGNTFDVLKKNILESVNLTFEDLKFVYTSDVIKLILDLACFFDFYKVINAKALSMRIGMNQSLLAQYINGVKKPSSLQTKRILKGVQQIGRELSEIQFLI
jgi:hypothetical protein